MIRSQSRGIGFGHLDHAEDAGGIDPELERSGFGRGALGEREGRGAVGHVEMDGHEPGARLEGRDVAAVHAVAFGKEHFGQRSAQIAGRAGDHRGGHRAIAAVRRRRASFCSLPLALRGSGSAPMVTNSGTL
jgi:hypothetical protein